MIVPASGHQVRCIPWVQMGIFNKEIGFLCGLKFFALNIFCGEYPQSSLRLVLQIWRNRYCERCANKKLCASKHTVLLDSCLGKLCLHPYLVVPLISARDTLISTRVSAHCQAILLERASWQRQCSGVCPISTETMSFYQYIGCEVSRDKRFIGYWNDLQGPF